MIVILKQDVSSDQIANAVDRNPLSHVKIKSPKKEAKTE